MEQIKSLKKLGLSKWAIAKKLNTSWQTIHMWDKGTFKPNTTHQQQLEELLKESVKK